MLNLAVTSREQTMYLSWFVRIQKLSKQQFHKRKETVMQEYSSQFNHTMQKEYYYISAQRI